MSVCLEPDKAAREYFLELEDQVAAQLSEHSSRDQRIFGKFLPPHDVKQRMVSALKVSTRGSEFLKLKLHWEKVRLWGPEGEEIPQQRCDLQGCHCRLRVELRQGLAHELAVRRARRDHGRDAPAAGAAPSRPVRSDALRPPASRRPG